MEKPKTKQAIRRELENHIKRYLQAGGHIANVEQGVSGRESNSALNSKISFAQGNKQNRTPLTDEVNAIDERKQQKKSQSTPTPRPKKRIIYDDFGEPIREIWE